MAKRKLNAMAVDPGAAPPPAKLEYNPETGNFNRSRANRPRSQVHTQRCVCGKDECKRNVKTCGLSLPPVGSPARLKTLKKLGVQFHPMDAHPRSQQSLSFDLASAPASPPDVPRSASGPRGPTRWP